MSKIVFWSPFHGQGQTSNLHIISLIACLIFNKKTLMMHTHFTMNNFEGPLIGKCMERLSTDDNSIFLDIGIDAAVMYSRMNQLVGDTLESCCITFPNTNLLLLPGTEIKNREIFERDISSTVCRMIKHSENCVDIIAIDTNSGNDSLSIKLISSADVIVVNLTQRRYVLKRLFMEYGDIMSNKNVFFLFGKYDKNSAYNIQNCRRKYRKFIRKENSGVIPYCTKFMDAQNECNIIGMVSKGIHNKDIEISKFTNPVIKLFNLRQNAAGETDEFFNQAYNSTRKIINMLNITEEKFQKESSGA